MADDETPLEKIERLRVRLTTQQRVFAEQFLVQGDPVEAYQAAYGRRNKTHAYAMMEHWAIAEYIAALHQVNRIDDVILPRGEIIARLKEIMYAKDAEYEDSIKAMALAAKILGYEAPRKHEHSVTATADRGLTSANVQEFREKLLGIEKSNVIDGKATEKQCALTHAGD